MIFLGMDFVLQKANFESFYVTFRRNIVEVCEKCELHTDSNDENAVFNLLEALPQIDFLNDQELLPENKRLMIKTAYENHPKAFLICYQLWRKFEHEFFYLQNETIKYAIYFELNTVDNLLSEIKKLVAADAKATVLVKSFF